MKRFFSIIISALMFSTFCYTTLAQTETITGTLTYKNLQQTPISGASVILFSETGTPIDTALTDTLGIYNFYNLYEGNYQLVFSTDLSAGGITVADAVIAALHRVGVITITDPLILAASDVDFNGSINIQDVKLIIKRYVNQIFQFVPNNWIFDNPWVNVSSDKNTTNTSGNGTSTGDLNGSYSPPISKEDDRYLLAEGQTMRYSEAGSIVSIPVEISTFSKTTEDIAAIGLVIEFPVDIAEILSITSELEGVEYTVHDNEVRIGWINPDLLGNKSTDFPPVFNFNMKPKKEFLNSGREISLTLNQQESEIVGYKGEILSGYTITMPKIAAEASGFSVAVFPNPSVSDVNIMYNIPAAGSVSISVRDFSGRLISENVFSHSDAGTYTFIPEVLNAGIYLYTVNYNNGEAVSGGKFSRL